MSKHMPDWYFHLMTFEFKLRDIFRPRKNVLADIGIKPGDHVLDYGCGPGGYIKTAAGMAGESGRIYALDINPLAIKYVKGLIERKKLSSVTTILSSCATGLPDGSIDVILFYDILHGLAESEPALKHVAYLTGEIVSSNGGKSQVEGILAEFKRVLKPEGILSISDHHMKQEEIIAAVEKSGLFKLHEIKSRTLSFAKK
jgi:ubiquinone/menaquinone biosynthesis C-methylase UbiE